MRNMLVTAGSTTMPIDRVRILTNIFKGRTGERIATTAAQTGWRVTLLTSRSGPENILEPSGSVKRVRYRTFDELAELMEREVREGNHDVVIHSAAVSDYRPDGAYVVDAAGQLVPLNATGSAAAKIPSNHERLYIGLTPTFKIIDRIREPWGFRGTLVKFKLQVDMSDEELLGIAGRSMAHSKADYIVANCLEWSDSYAYIMSADGSTEKVRRDLLPISLLGRLK